LHRKADESTQGLPRWCRTLVNKTNEGEAWRGFVYFSVNHRVAEEYPRALRSCCGALRRQLQRKDTAWYPVRLRCIAFSLFWVQPARR
jgi:hypothetical protein